MTHLRSRLSAVVDGQLDPAQTERALAHVAVCPRCAAELAAARAARALLADTATSTPRPDPALTSRLLAMRAVPPARPGDPFMVSVRGPAHPSVVGGEPVVRGEPSMYGEPRTYRDQGVRGDLGERRPSQGLAVVSLAGIAVLFLAHSMGAAAPPDLPEVVLAGPQSATVAVVDLAAHTPVVPDPAALRAEGWVIPDTLPPGWTMTAARSHEGEKLEVDLAGPGDASATVIEHHGPLDVDHLGDVLHTYVGDVEVAVLSSSPWTVAWQTAGTVVELCADVDAEALVASFSAVVLGDGG
ncbi:MAG: zf-HC2 domain-containing protein [Micrococcales bacterium]|nr:zf-HC2 domain-containing protein [Micrococcales bacterium]